MLACRRLQTGWARKAGETRAGGLRTIDARRPVKGHVAPLQLAAAFKQQYLRRSRPKAVQNFLEAVKSRTGNSL